MWNGAPNGEGPRRPPRPPNVNLPSGTAHLLYELDKVLLFWLRDGRTFIGVLKSLDQFGNVVVSGTIERIYVGTEFGDIERGICILRGENLVLVGEWDSDKEQNSGTKRRDIQYILTRQMEEEEKRLKVKEGLQKAMRERGLNIRDDPEDDLFIK
jgi:U6 snRNA-associated Sm-like protein LSm1